ncbi:MAG: hypothetical protein MUQ10_06900 [Anaerolineae bacterium]|nr:hypothetical protein [Anaerolineae bacterium]
MKDVQDIEETIYSQERQKLASKGWCAELLRLQDKDGLWNGSLYSGKWISTTYTLYLLKILGLSPFNHQALAACDQLFTQGIYHQQEIRISRNQEHQDLGVTGLILSLCCYFGYHQDQLHSVAEFLIDAQCRDGNWLPDRSESSTAYTFETTLIVLEGLLQYRNRYSVEDRRLSEAEENGQEYLLKHELYLAGGKAIKKQWTTFSFPPYWFYDVLTVLEYFRCLRTNRDKRMQAGIDLINAKQNRHGTWNLGSKHPGKTHFEMERPREPSRWNTLRALRVLEWWGGGD